MTTEELNQLEARAREILAANPRGLIAVEPRVVLELLTIARKALGKN